MYRAVSPPLEGAAHHHHMLAGDDSPGEDVLGSGGVFKGHGVGRASHGHHHPPEPGGLNVSGVAVVLYWTWTPSRASSVW